MKVTVLGCGGSGGVPLIGRNWGDLQSGQSEEPAPPRLGRWCEQRRHDDPGRHLAGPARAVPGCRHRAGSTRDALHPRPCRPHPRHRRRALPEAAGGRSATDSGLWHAPKRSDCCRTASPTSSRRTRTAPATSTSRSCGRRGRPARSSIGGIPVTPFEQDHGFGSTTTGYRVGPWPIRPTSSICRTRPSAMLAGSRSLDRRLPALRAAPDPCAFRPGDGWAER